MANRGGVVDSLVGGWQLATIVKWQTGAPLSIESNRGTFNRTGRSGRQTAVTSLSEQQIRDLLGLFELPDGRIFFINPSVVDSSGRLVGPDTLDGQSFNGQVFFNPGPGEVGSLVVNTVDSLDRIERAVSGAPVVKPRHDTFYGTTEFVCEGAGREPCRLRRDQEAVVGIHGAGS